jgi:hypothetical protein
VAAREASTQYIILAIDLRLALLQRSPLATEKAQLNTKSCVSLG